MEETKFGGTVDSALNPFENRASLSTFHLPLKEISSIRGGIGRLWVLCFQMVFHTDDWSVSFNFLCK
jgi:hypothetical protein